MLPRRLLLLLALTCGLAAGCNEGGAGGGLRVPMPDADLTGTPLNLDGIPYPTTDIGGRPRNDVQRGQVFPNLTLQGIRSFATIEEPAVVSMTEFYDPTSARIDLLHVMGVFLWCPHCRNETAGLVKLASFRAERRVAVIQIAMEGYGSEPPAWSDLQKWVRDQQLDFPVVADAGGEALGRYFGVNSVPLNIMVDPRTMEILAVDVGEVSDLAAYEQGFLDGG